MSKLVLNKPAHMWCQGTESCIEITENNRLTPGRKSSEAFVQSLPDLLSLLRSLLVADIMGFLIHSEHMKMPAVGALQGDAHMQQAALEQMLEPQLTWHGNTRMH